MVSSSILIQRNRLTKPAQESLYSHILYVQAPAGYGKTVFASQWLDSRQEPNAVVRLDEYDNSAGDICLKLKNALNELYIEKDTPEVCAFTKHSDFNKAPVEFLMRAVTAAPRDSRANLVIDDLHYVTDPYAHKVLKDFFMRLPEGIKICILSRTALPDAFSGLLLKNEIQFLPQVELLFTEREIRALYKSRNLPITKKQAESILTFTEGWPIGINALLLSSKQIPTEMVSRDWLESFLRTQVWDMWDENSKEFMVGTCIEEELSEDLCNALMGREDSGRILEQLAEEGAFLSRQKNGTFRFHNLFSEFLRKLFQEKPKEYRTRQIREAGKWYLEKKDFYHAVDRFSCIKEYEQMVNCFDLLEEMDRGGFDTEQIMHAVHTCIDHELLDRYPHLYFMMAFTARNEGRIKEFAQYADEYYRRYPQILQRNPMLAHNILFLYAMDTRFTLDEISKMAVSIQGSSEFQGVRGSATLYFPYYHRSFRDLSELLPGNIDERVEEITKILGPLLGEECRMLKACICGGLYYEQGNLQKARELALLAAGEMKDCFAPESKFCVMALLLTVTHAMKQTQQEEILQIHIQEMIEKDKAYYLQYNFDAVLCRNRLDVGDTGAAQKWLETRGIVVYGQLDFFRLYGHFTTARANILLENYNQSVILLEKLLELCKALNRPSDVIEAEILLAVCFWKMKGNNRKKAYQYLEEAVAIAQKLGYEQAFINDGAELKNLFSGLKNWTMRSDYSGSLSGTFVKKLYIGTAEKSNYSSVFSGSSKENSIRFTAQQKKVAGLMCEGYSYRKIAEELGVQFSTVRSHIELIYRKLDVSSMDEAILKIRRLHLLEE